MSWKKVPLASGVTGSNVAAVPERAQGGPCTNWVWGAQARNPPPHYNPEKAAAAQVHQTRWDRDEKG